MKPSQATTVTELLTAAPTSVTEELVNLKSSADTASPLVEAAADLAPEVGYAEWIMNGVTSGWAGLLAGIAAGAAWLSSWSASTFQFGADLTYVGSNMTNAVAQSLESAAEYVGENHLVGAPLALVEGAVAGYVGYKATEAALGLAKTGIQTGYNAYQARQARLKEAADAAAKAAADLTAKADSPARAAEGPAGGTSEVVTAEMHVKDAVHVVSPEQQAADLGGKSAALNDADSPSRRVTAR